ncbi:MAG: hypothetical protein HQL88_06930 [Magnetococcales bacterium]|nr:hypothetical protein [Magnetococcales bacterium]
MAAILFVGDALSGAGWALAGVQVVVPGAGEEAEWLTQLCAPPTQLLLLTVAVARSLPLALQQRLFTLVTPLVLVVPDVQGSLPMPDLAETVRKQLGVGL